MEPVSVVIPTYQRAPLLPGTLRSILAAIEPGDEIIVVDDGSTDGTAQVVQAADAPWRGLLRYVARPHAGAGRAFNAGIAAARHDLVAFADSDDLWLPWRLALGRALMERERGLVYCFSDFAHLWAGGRVDPHWLVRWSGDRRPWSEILGPGWRYADRFPLPAALPEADHGFRVHVGSMQHAQLHANHMSVNTLLARRSLAGGALHFGEDIPRLADWECYARLSAAGPGAYLDLDTAVQVAHDGPRLSHLGEYPYAVARTAIIERTWAKDPDFMARHGDEVAALLAALRRTTLRHLIREQRVAEARRLLPLVPRAWRERLALALPRALLAALLALRDRAAWRHAGQAAP